MLGEVSTPEAPKWPLPRVCESRTVVILVHCWAVGGYLIFLCLVCKHSCFTQVPTFNIPIFKKII